MTALHVPAGEGPHHLMIDGDHVVKAAVHDAAGAFEVFESPHFGRSERPGPHCDETLWRRCGLLPLAARR